MKAIERSPSDEGWQELLAVLDRVPFVSGLKRDITSLSRLVAQRRAPRILVVGSRGSGRRALANALMSAVLQNDVVLDSLESSPNFIDGRWVDIDIAGRRLDWVQLELGQSIVTQAKRTTDLRHPDVVILVATPDEVQRGLGVHLEALTSILGTLDGESRPTAISVLTKVDTLPTTVAASLTKQAFATQLTEASLPKVLHLATTAGIAELSEAIVEALPEPARVEGARTFLAAVSARREVASTVIRCSSTLAITVAITPLPLSDIAVLAPLQAMMVTTLAYISGRPWDRKTATEWLGSVGVIGGAGLGMRWGAQQLSKLVPGMGSIVSASIAGTGTLALGRSALRYFLEEEMQDNSAPL